MSHIFISYNHDDGDFADSLKEKVREAGFEPWIDIVGLRAGEDWRAEIDQAIKEASALIAVMTPKAKESEYVTYEWAFALGAGVKVIPILLKPTDPHPRLGALQYLDFTNRMARPWDKLIEALQEAVNHAPQMIRVPSDVPLVIKKAVAALDSPSPAERKAAIGSLAQTNHPAAREALAKAVQHPIQGVRIHAAFALVPFKDARAVPGLIEALRGGKGWKDKGTSLTAARKLRQIGDAAVPTLIDALHDENDDIREIAAQALGYTGDTAAVPSLLDALRDENSNVRRYAAMALGGIGDTAAVPSLLDALRDESDDVRDYAAIALRAIGTPEALAAVEEWSRRQQGGSTRGPIRRGIRKP